MLELKFLIHEALADVRKAFLFPRHCVISGDRHILLVTEIPGKESSARFERTRKVEGISRGKRC